MPATVSADFNFTPKVWKDHVMAFYRRRLVAGAFAMMDDTLKSEPGTTINFPYFKKIGDVEEPTEDEGLLVDKLSDDSFSVTIKEVSKAVGIKKKAFKTSAAKSEEIVSEIQRQIGRVFAEKVDKDLITEFGTTGNYVDGYRSATIADKMTVANLNTGRITGFGDLFGDAKVCFMHSLQFLTLMNSSTTGFLQANALDPMFLVDGFQGRLLGMALVVTDNLGTSTSTDASLAYNSYIHKENPYGIMMKQEMEIESDYDILHREWLFTGDNWYGVKSFHAKIATDDYKTIRIRTAV